MKRFLSVFLCAILLVCVMVVPTFASEDIILYANDEFGRQPFVVPEGDYMVYFSYDAAGGDSMRLHSNEPVSIRYELDNFELLCTVVTTLYDKSDQPLEVGLMLNAGEDFTNVAYSFTPDSSDSWSYFYFPAGATASITLIPVESPPPTLSGVVDSNMLDGVFNEILSLLPVIVIIIVGFIAIRKGIAFLTDVLRQA